MSLTTQTREIFQEPIEEQQLPTKTDTNFFDGAFRFVAILVSPIVFVINLIAELGKPTQSANKEAPSLEGRVEKVASEISPIKLKKELINLCKKNFKTRCNLWSKEDAKRFNEIWDLLEKDPKISEALRECVKNSFATDLGEKRGWPTGKMYIEYINKIT